MSKPVTSSSFDKSLNVSAGQAAGMPPGYRHYQQKIPSVSAPAWGGYFTFQVKNKGVHLDDMVLEFNLSALSGLTVSASGTAANTPAWWWFSRIDVLIGSLVVDSIYPLANYLSNQYFAGFDEKRTLINAGAGDTTHAGRATISAATSTWYLPISSFADQSSFPFLSNTPDLEIRVYMDALANQFTLTSGSTSTGTAAQTINSCNLLCRFSEIPQYALSTHVAINRKGTVHYPFSEVRQQSFSISSGVSSSTLVLTAITGYTSHLFFAIRSSNPTGANQFTFSSVLSTFDLLDGGSSPLLGGQPISAAQNRYIQASKWVNTTFSSSTDGAYLYCFAADPQATNDKGIHTNAYHFRGNEQLVLRFTSSLGSAIQVDVYAFTHSALEVSGPTVRKIPLSSS